jgi:hypothetical protein
MKTLGLVLLLTTALAAQPRYGRSRNLSNGTNPLPQYQGLTATFHGKLKEINKKEIVIQNDDDQIVSIRRNGKTKFLNKDAKEVKPTELEAETVVTIDVSEDNDMKPMALKVVADPNQKPKEQPELVKRELIKPN